MARPSGEARRARVPILAAFVASLDGSSNAEGQGTMIVGIDLGTTNSLCAVFRDGEARLVPNALGETLTPSAVHLDVDGAISVGRAAKERLSAEPHRATAKFKRLMGTDRTTKLGGREFRPEELSALVLGSLKADAEAYLDEPVTEAVISVPAYFNDVQRKATIAAARMAGLEVRRLVNEPTAAALAYGVMDREAENTFLIVDLGGGTFDVSILEMFSGVMEVRSSAGDAFLGGEDFTDRVTAHLLEELGLKTDGLDPADLARLRKLADGAKHRLGTQASAEIGFRMGEEERTLTLTRETFERLGEPLLNRLRLPIQRAIQDAGLTASGIDRIFLVGGATRMGAVRSLVTRLFDRFPEHGIDPDTVVALGAAVQAGLVERDEALDEMVMTDVCPFTLGHETSNELAPGKREYGLFAPLIERNTTVPASRSHQVFTLNPGQTKIGLNIYQGEAPYVKDNVKIGAYTVAVPYNAKESEGLDVRFTYDNSGVLEVVATSLSTGKASTLIIESNPGSMSPKEIAERFKALERIKRHPREEAANEAVLARLSAAYANSLGERRDFIAGALSRFQAVLESYDKRAIEDTRGQMTELLEGLEAEDVFR